MLFKTDEEPYVITRDWKNMNYDLLENNFINSDKYTHMLTDHDVNRVTINLINEIQHHYNNLVPIIKVKCENKDKVQLSKNTKALIEKKNNAYKSMKENRTNDNIKDFKILSKMCRKRIIIDKDNKINNDLRNQKNPKKLWNATKKLLYGNKFKSINRIIENNKFIQGSQKVSNVLNRFFVWKPREILGNLPVNDINPMDFYAKHVEKKSNTFFLKPINISDLRKVMSSVKRSNSYDYYGINMKMIFNIRRALEPILLNIINLSIYNSEFPSVLKISKIIPIPKDINYLLPKNYRAINIFCPISKIIEKCWSVQINNYLVKNNYLKENHQGGIKGRGTVTATININTKINKIVDNKNIAAVIGLDQSSCFEIINHNILLEKMKHIGFNLQTCNLLKQYLSDRKQYTEINIKCFDLLLTGNLSIFQGSILSVIFYNIFTLDIPFISHNILNNSVNHNSHYEYFKCGNPFLVSYIDDLFAVIEGDKDNIWTKIKKKTI